MTSECVHINEEIPTGQHGGQSSYLFWAVSALGSLSEEPVQPCMQLRNKLKV